MKKLLYSVSFLLVIGGAISPALSFGKNYNPEEGEGGKTKCRKSNVNTDYCWRNGVAQTGCANSTATDDC